MHNKKLIKLTLIIVILILSFSGGCSKKDFNNNSIVVDGVIDLTQLNFEKEVIRLNGQWEFYWNKLLEPQELNSTNLQSDGYIDLPSSWNGYNINSKELTGDGYATYRLSFKIEEKGKLALKIPRIFTSYNLWINGQQLSSAGKVGRNKETSSPQYLPKVVFFDAQKGENQMVIQVSNFYHRSGGILESITLGSEELILGSRYKKIALQLFLFGILMIIGIYHLSLFYFRKKDFSLLYFGLFSLFVGIRTILVGESFFIYLLPNFNWEAAHKIQTLLFYLGVPLIVMYSKEIFPIDFSQKIVKIVQSIGLIFGALVLLTPARIFTLFNPVYQIFTFLTIVYIILIFIKKLYRRDRDSSLVIIGCLIMIFTSLNDMVFLSIWMNDSSSSVLRTICRTGNLSSIGQLIFVFTNSLVLAKKFSVALEKEEVMTVQLKEINSNLDDLVNKRTQALNKSNKEIENQKTELEKMNYILYLLSLKDPLTNLWNRRHFDNTLEIEWRRSLRNKEPLALMMIDIDYFKDYNDCYGHSAGDECLRLIANAINDNFKRASDLVARYGGEEFVVILPGFGKDQAIKMGESLRKKIENLDIIHDCSPISPNITVSIGITSIIPDANSSQTDLMIKADKALYQAKNAKRNQVEFI
jgi:diguanylate cyclase (GGDEF)-like protein